MKRAVFAIAVVLFSCGGSDFQSDPESPAPPVSVDGATPPADRPDAELAADAGAVGKDAAPRNPLADAWPDGITMDPEMTCGVGADGSACPSAASCGRGYTLRCILSPRGPWYGCGCGPVCDADQTYDAGFCYPPK